MKDEILNFVIADLVRLCESLLDLSESETSDPLLAAYVRDAADELDHVVTLLEDSGLKENCPVLRLVRP